METKIISAKSKDIAVVYSEEIVICDSQSALDFIMSVSYNTGCNKIILNKAALSEEFFKLKTGIAGEVLQKFINYHVKIAFIGDFSIYSSKSLKDFIYESNKGKDIFFLNNESEAVEKLSQ